MATLTYNPITKQFTLSYSYTNAKGKVREVNPKPRGLTALTNQILKAQERGVTEFTGSVSSQELSTLDAVATVSGAGNNYTVSIIGFGNESSSYPSAGAALRELVHLGKEYSDPLFRKALRKKRFSINFGN